MSDAIKRAAEEYTDLFPYNNSEFALCMRSRKGFIAGAKFGYALAVERLKSDEPWKWCHDNQINFTTYAMAEYLESKEKE